MGDIVGVLKKSDPCGNPQNWFVDNGLVKGIVSASILTPHSEKTKAAESMAVQLNSSTFDESPRAVIASRSLKEAPTKNSAHEWSDHRVSISDDEFDTNNLHNYVNSETFVKDEVSPVPSAIEYTLFLVNH